MLIINIPAKLKIMLVICNFIYARKMLIMITSKGNLLMTILTKPLTNMLLLNAITVLYKNVPFCFQMKVHPYLCLIIENYHVQIETNKERILS